MRHHAVRIFWAVAGTLLTVAGFAAGNPVARAPAVPCRIVSLAPSTTEILFALGLGDRVVGVTRYCTYPAAALTRTKVGGYCDPDYEAILRLHPDLVVVLTEHEAALRFLSRFHVTTLRIDHATLDDIVHSITVIGRACGAAHAADSLVADLSARMEKIRKNAGAVRPRVLVSVSRSAGRISDLCVAGGGTYYDELIRLAGGRNAFTNKNIAFPMISLEGLYRINPEVVIDLVPEGSGKKITAAALRADWESVGRIDAVKMGRVYLFGQDFTEIPGPRFILLLEQMAKAIHPELYGMNK
jgi:iron complex transport system substrate-binding protein